jgi:curved DNA-binding protein CbpA/phage FluMu protein Com
MKNYYRILQIDPEAEPEVIEAAYKRLMRKYHPDLNSGGQTVDKSLLEKVQEINEAHDILSDAEKRREYHNLWKVNEGKAEINPQNTPEISSPVIEKRVYTVRCSVSKHTYYMQMIRNKGREAKFNILGFEPAFHYDAQEERSWLAQKVDNLFKMSRKRKNEAQKKTRFVSDKEIENLYTSGNMISISDVLWIGNNNCPDCGMELVRSDGSIVHWLRCGTCSRLFCVGSAKLGLQDSLRAKCPWCNVLNIIERKTRSKQETIIGGQKFVSEQTKEQNLLSGKNQKTLSDGKK